MKRNFVRGIVLLFPVALTLVVTLWLYNALTLPVASLLSLLGLPLWISQLITIPLLIVFLILLGFGLKFYLFRKFVEGGRLLFKKIPLVKSIYNASHDVVSGLIKDENRGFANVVLVNYPSRDGEVVGFIPRLDNAINDKLFKGDLIPVFVPGCVNPLMGFLLFFHKKDIKFLEIGVDEALKWTMSAGIVPPKSFLK